MNGIVNFILSFTATALMGCVCGFLVLLNCAKDETRRKNKKNGKTNR